MSDRSRAWRRSTKRPGAAQHLSPRRSAAGAARGRHRAGPRRRPRRGRAARGDAARRRGSQRGLSAFREPPGSAAWRCAPPPSRRWPSPWRASSRGSTAGDRPAVVARAGLRAVGTAYLRFAQAETGLFRTAFSVPDDPEGDRTPRKPDIAASIRSSCWAMRSTVCRGRRAAARAAARRGISGLVRRAWPGHARHRGSAAPSAAGATAGHRAAPARYGGEGAVGAIRCIRVDSRPAGHSIARRPNTRKACLMASPLPAIVDETLALLGRGRLCRRPQPGDGALPGAEAGPAAVPRGRGRRRQDRDRQGAGRRRSAGAWCACSATRASTSPRRSMSGTTPRQMIEIRLAEAAGRPQTARAWAATSSPSAS